MQQSESSLFEMFQLKDLKRQLQAERKRADKLQEKLQEFLSDSRSRQC